MLRAVFTYAVVVMIAVALVCPPARAVSLVAGLGNGPGVCKMTGRKECPHHRACPVKADMHGRHNGSSKAHTCDAVIKCSGSMDNGINNAFFDGTVFITASGAWPLHIPNGVFSLGPEAVSYPKAAYSQIERPPEK